MRTCAHCHSFMIDGWIDEEFEFYYCSKECLEIYYPNFFTQEEEQEEEVFYTTWYNETEIYLFNDTQYANVDSAVHVAYSTGFTALDIQEQNYNQNKPLYYMVDGQLVELNLGEIIAV